jgi:glyoxylase I family protein
VAKAPAIAEGVKKGSDPNSALSWGLTPSQHPPRYDRYARGVASGAVHHVDLTVRDLAVSLPFYDRVMALFGFVRTKDVPEGPIFAGATVEIGLVEARSRATHDRYAAGLHHLAFSAPSRAAVDEAHAKLVALGATILDAPAEYPQYAPGYYAVFFADPDGLKLEYVYTPRWPA